MQTPDHNIFLQQVSPSTLTPTNTFTPIAPLTAMPSRTGTQTPSTPVFSNAQFIYNGNGQRVKSDITTNITQNLRSLRSIACRWLDFKPQNTESQVV